MLKSFLSVLFCFIFIASSGSYAQQDGADKIELRDGKVLLGNVIKIKPSSIEFKELKTSLLYEWDKKDIKYINLQNGQIITFESDFLESQTKRAPQQQQTQPIIIEKESGAGAGTIILATVGVVLLVLILIGAAAGG